MSSSHAAAIQAATDPATRLRLELEDQRKKVVPKRMQNCLKHQLRELQHLRERVILEEEEMIIAAGIKRLRQELVDKDRLIEQLQTEGTVFATTYNARVNFYRQLQELSDSVAELEPHQATPGALKQDIAQLKAKGGASFLCDMS